MGYLWAIILCLFLHVDLHASGEEEERVEGMATSKSRAPSKEMREFLLKKIGFETLKLRYESDSTPTSRRLESLFLASLENREKPKNSGYKLLNSPRWKSLDQLFMVMGSWKELGFESFSLEKDESRVRSHQLKILNACLGVGPDEISQRLKIITQEVVPEFVEKGFKAEEEDFLKGRLVGAALAHSPSDILKYKNTLCFCKSSLLIGDNSGLLSYFELLAACFSIPVEKIHGRVGIAGMCLAHSLNSKKGKAHSKIPTRRKIFNAYLSLSPEKAKCIAENIGALCFDVSLKGHPEVIEACSELSIEQIKAISSVSKAFFPRRLLGGPNRGTFIRTLKNIEPKEIEKRAKNIMKNSNASTPLGSCPGTLVALFRLLPDQVTAIAENKNFLFEKFRTSKTRERLFRECLTVTSENIRSRAKFIEGFMVENPKIEVPSLWVGQDLILLGLRTSPKNLEDRAKRVQWMKGTSPFQKVLTRGNTHLPRLLELTVDQMDAVQQNAKYLFSDDMDVEERLSVFEACAGWPASEIEEEAEEVSKFAQSFSSYLLPNLKGVKPEVHVATIEAYSPYESSGRSAHAKKLEGFRDLFFKGVSGKPLYNMFLKALKLKVSELEELSLKMKAYDLEGVCSEVREEVFDSCFKEVKGTGS